MQGLFTYARYVAMHAMQNDHQHEHHDAEPKSSRYALRQLSAAVIGMLFPLLTMIGHAH